MANSVSGKTSPDIFVKFIPGVGVLPRKIGPEPFPMTLMNFPCETSPEKSNIAGDAGAEIADMTVRLSGVGSATSNFQSPRVMVGPLPVPPVGLYVHACPIALVAIIATATTAAALLPATDHRSLTTRFILFHILMPSSFLFVV